MDNSTLQLDEIQALTAIYGSEWKTEDINVYSIKINEGSFETIAYFKFPTDYPLNVSPELELSAPSMPRDQKQKLLQDLNLIYTENNGEPVIYQWIEKIREFLQTLSANIKPEVQTIDENISQMNIKKHDCPTIHHGSTIQDRKSIFQGHAAPVQSVEDVKAVMNSLLENKKIAEATHNISAYRIKMEKGNILQDCDDDGENQAGRRLLHLLQITDVTNVVVVVSRWYGGIQLGPDRFRHINNAARQILEQADFIVKKK